MEINGVFANVIRHHQSGMERQSTDRLPGSNASEVPTAILTQSQVKLSAMALGA
jgi:hypothetical protein